MKSQRLRAQLALRRDEPTPYIPLELPIDPLVNSEHCDTISQALQDEGSPWECKLATPGLGDLLPERPGLYMFLWHPAVRLICDSRPPISFRYVLYVGQAGAKGGSKNTLRARYRGEYAKLVARDPKQLWSAVAPRDRKERLLRFLALSPLEYCWCIIDDTDVLFRLERRLLTIFNPPAVVHGRARLDRKKTQNAFSGDKEKKNGK